MGTTKQSKNWLKELKKCNWCKKNICVRCDKMKLHKNEQCDKYPEHQRQMTRVYYWRSYKTFEYYDRDECAYYTVYYNNEYDFKYCWNNYCKYEYEMDDRMTLNEHLIDYNLIKSSEPRRNRKFVKKLTQKRKNDKKGNIKYRKRSNRRKEISFIIKNEL